MRQNQARGKSLPVLAAGAVVVLLAGLLGLRLRGARPLSAPEATVPEPQSVTAGTLAVPCWGCEWARDWPVRFRTDLDLLAPLGRGPANAAAWFRDFAKPGGSRYSEAVAAMERRVQGPGDAGKILPANDPLLREAEPWCDQATMRFYPEFFFLKGYDTQLPNLLLPLTFARSWLARGRAEADPDRALADFRRVVRLGRLLRQEDAIVASDLVGIACVRIGAEAIYDLAAKRGDKDLMLAAAIVQGEASAQRLITAERLTRIDLLPYVRKGARGEVSLDLPDSKLYDVLKTATASPDLRFRDEALLGLNLVRFLGSKAQQEKALAVLNQVASSAEGNGNVATIAAWSRDTRPTRGYLEGLRETILKP